jgi:hypothetical protein
MKRILQSLLAAGVLLAGGLAGGPRALADRPADNHEADEKGVEVQTRGPIHEGFAAMTTTDPETGPTVPKKPPEPIKEVPPKFKPKGENVQWLPGYWAWDDERKDFIWVSGVWRVPPRGRHWVPGHWTGVKDGYEWVHGFWAKAGQEKLQYLPEPPESQEEGPSSPYKEDSFYVPGCWLWSDGDWKWRPGYWREYQEDHVWIPSCYYWTPNGCIYNSGYWDYPLEDRGVLCAPVYFNQPLWTDPDWSFQPDYYCDWPGILDAFFCRPDWCWYYFGDWYGRGYRHRGFRPWYAWGGRHFDPLFGHERWSHRDDPNWRTHLRDTFRGRDAGRLTRPARTLARQRALLARGNLPRGVNRNSLLLANSFRSARSTGRFTTLSSTRALRYRNAVNRFNNIRQARIRTTARAGSRASTLTLPRSAYFNRTARNAWTRTTRTYRSARGYSPRTATTRTYRNRSGRTYRPSTRTTRTYRRTPTTRRYGSTRTYYRRYTPSPTRTYRFTPSRSGPSFFHGSSFHGGSFRGGGHHR